MSWLDTLGELSPLVDTTDPLNAGAAQTSDIPTAPQSDNTYGTSATPDAGASTVGNSNTPTYSGILSAATTTAKDLIGLYGTVQNMGASVANSKYAAQVAQANFDLNKTVTLGNLAVAQTRAQAQISNGVAQAKATGLAGAGGGNWSLWLGVLGVVFAAAQYYKKSKA